MRFIGSVQGVGFRWTAKRLADRLGLSGSVGNNADGSVTLIARGDEGDIAAFVAELDKRFGPAITGVEGRDKPAGEISDGFYIVG
ncbi:MAG: acylphosphatase [Planctomycetota bacterium]|nr:acylphosphatase [Planctomycetota bacterium]